jgi:hypothetical protein
MKLEKHKAIFSLLKLAIIFYIIHKLFFLVFKANLKTETFYYSIETLYLFFSTCSILILFILLKVKEKSIDNLGMTFLLITSIKMIVCYVIVYPILRLTNQNSILEKINFLVLFILFLAFETIVTIRILNNKQ